MVMVMPMAEYVRIDRQGRVVIPKHLREKFGFDGEVEIIAGDDGVTLRPPKKKNWDVFLKDKLKVDWRRAMTVSLEGLNVDELMFGQE